MRTCLIACACLTILALGACSDSTEPDTDPNTPPHAEIEIYFMDYVSEGYSWTHFDANPLRCSDDRTPRHMLELRWDFEDDGEWDTEFTPLEYIEDIWFSPLPRGVLRTRCEVRDLEGLVSTAVDSLEMPDDWYEAPDIVARRAVVDTTRFEMSTTDTVHVGQTCYIHLSSLRWLDETGCWGDEFTNELYIDGELALDRVLPAVQRLHRGIATYEYGPYYGEPVVFDGPGIHTLTVVVDVTDAVAETDETNNSFTRTLVVIP